jgi:hypothetical protein
MSDTAAGIRFPIALPIRARHFGPPAARRFALIVLAVGVTLASTTSFADIAPPRPATFWDEGDAPRISHVICAGICLSAGAISLAVIVARRPGPRSRKGKVGLTALVVTSFTIVSFTLLVPLWLAWEQAQWRGWHRDRYERRQHLQRRFSEMEQAKRDASKGSKGEQSKTQMQPK